MSNQDWTATKLPFKIFDLLVLQLQAGAGLHVEGQRKAGHVAPQRGSLLPAPARQVGIVILLPADVVEALSMADEVDGLHANGTHPQPLHILSQCFRMCFQT
jgi:hypothetical protein